MSCWDEISSMVCQNVEGKVGVEGGNCRVCASLLENWLVSCSRTPCFGEIRRSHLYLYHAEIILTSDKLFYWCTLLSF